MCGLSVASDSELNASGRDDVSCFAGWRRNALRAQVLSQAASHIDSPNLSCFGQIPIPLKAENRTQNASALPRPFITVMECLLRPSAENRWKFS
jgi:hypothetical protein